MIKTITEYRPGIYLILARREAARRAREERTLRRIDFCADCVLGLTALGWVVFCAWFTVHVLLP